MSVAETSDAGYQVKGSAVAGIVEFVRGTFGEKGFARWLSLLSSQARTIASEPITYSAWHPGNLIAEMRLAIVNEFFGADRSRMRELGKFTARKSFTGVYKLAIRLGSPSWVIGRIGMVFEQMYRPGKVTVLLQEDRHAIVRLDGFPDNTGIMAHVFCGALDVAGELSGAKNFVVTTRKIDESSDHVYEVEVRWQ